MSGCSRWGPSFGRRSTATPRHLNEYTGLDFEMGYIRSFYDIMEVEAGFLRHAMELLGREYSRELALLGVELPDASSIPCLRFDEAKRLAAERYGLSDPGSLRPGAGGGGTTSAGTPRRSWAATSSLSPTTPPGSAPFTPWTTRTIRDTPFPLTCCSGGWR